MSFFSYFDLNRQSIFAKASHDAEITELMQVIKDNVHDSDWIEIKKKSEAANDEHSMSLWEQITTYLGIVVGVFFSSAAAQMKSGASLNMNISVPSILLSLVIAFVILPVAYEKLNVNPASPLLIRIGLAVQHGVFWQVLFGSIGNMIG